jgi:hypothetical protein
VTSVVLHVTLVIILTQKERVAKRVLAESTVLRRNASIAPTDITSRTKDNLNAKYVLKVVFRILKERLASLVP